MEHEVTFAKITDSVSRRGFLALAGAFAVSPGIAAVRLGAPELKLGVISDIHIYGTRTFPYKARPNRHTQGETVMFEKALRHFDAAKVDGVLIAGDLTENGVDTQLQLVADVWNRVFPGDRGSDGRHVEKLFIYGNHDAQKGLIFNKPLLAEFRRRLKTDEAFEAYRRDHGILPREKEVWERVFGEAWSPIIHKTLKGRHFFLANWGHEREAVALMRRELLSIGGFMPFFYVQHAAITDTCWKSQGMVDPKSRAIRDLLAAHHNAIAVTGHNHFPLTDERNVWQEEFTAFGASTLAYASAQYGRENSGPKQGRGGREKQMPILWQTSECKQGMVLCLYRDRMLLERRDFWNDCAVGDDWIVPLPAAPGGPMSHGTRAQKARPPEFPKDAVVSLLPAEGRERESGAKRRQVAVSFPGAVETPQRRAFDYSVAVEAEGGEPPVPSKRVISTCFHLPARVAMARNMPQECVFALHELPRNGRFRFAVRAADSFGNESMPIASKWVSVTDFTIQESV